MPLRIACDLDGTLADMDAALQHEAEQLFGPDVDLRANRRIIINRPAADRHELRHHDYGSPRPQAKAEGQRRDEQAEPASIVKRPLSGLDVRKLWARVAAIENFWTTLEEVESGSVARLAELAAKHGWEILFLTRRPVTVGDTPQVQTQRWLQAKGFELPSVFVVKGSRGRIADALTLDAVVDDLPENVIDVATDSKATPILVWREAPVLLPPTAASLSRVVHSFREALVVLDAMTTPPTRTERLLRRVRSAMRMSSRADVR